MKSRNQKFRDIDEYHALQPTGIRETLEQLRQAIRQAAPMATETISYGMPAFRQRKVLVYYALHQNHIGFYPTPDPMVHFKKELEKYSTSKGAIQFPVDKPIPLTLIKKIVKFRLDADSKSMHKKIESGVVHEVPDDLGKSLKAEPDILERWNNLTPVQRNEWICWVTIVKKPETKAEHIHRLIEDLKNGKGSPVAGQAVRNGDLQHKSGLKKSDICRQHPNTMNEWQK
ncbi:MAG: DUF1801 domain-containing protein [Bacteroidales bacterium]